MYRLEVHRMRQRMGTRYYGPFGDLCSFRVPSDGLGWASSRRSPGNVLLVLPEKGDEYEILVPIQHLDRLEDPVSAARYWAEMISRTVVADRESVKMSEQILVQAQRAVTQAQEHLNRARERMARTEEMREDAIQYLRRLESAEPGSLSVPPSEGGEVSCVEG